jgi:putative transposase
VDAQRQARAAALARGGAQSAAPAAQAAASGEQRQQALRLRATRVNEVWSYDFVFDQTEDGQRLKWLPICDEFSRESVALEVERRMESADVIRILDAAVAERETAPDFIRSDNGPEFIAADVPAW